MKLSEFRGYKHRVQKDPPTQTFFCPSGTQLPGQILKLPNIGSENLGGGILHPSTAPGGHRARQEPTRAGPRAHTCFRHVEVPDRQHEEHHRRQQVRQPEGGRRGEQQREQRDGRVPETDRPVHAGRSMGTGALRAAGAWAGTHWKRGGVPPPPASPPPGRPAYTQPTHCPPDGRCRLQWHL